jgi:CRISPR-associated protein Csb2
MLTLELELLTGLYRAALPNGAGAEWPPHPERVFSALVQAWGDGGEQDEERAALEWLERLPPPVIEASPRDGADGAACVSSRDAPAVFVPPNDASGDKIEVLPHRRLRQSRTFQASIPERTLVRMQWREQPEAGIAGALGALANRVASVGHSSSLVRVVFRTDEVPLDPACTWSPAERAGEPLRVAYVNRLADLRHWHSAEGEKKVERPRSLRTVRYAPPGVPRDEEAAESTFGGPADWLVFEESARDERASFRPDLLGLGRVAKRLRDVLMTRGPQPPPEILSGHAGDGGPSQRPHIAFVPLANVGWDYADGELLGMAVVLPRRLDTADRRRALGGIAAALDMTNGAGTLELEFRAGTWRLERAPLPSRASLRPERWCEVSTRWASATPVLLDRFPDREDPIEVARILAGACRNVGLPEPRMIEIHKHSAVRAAPSAYPARGSANSPGWSFPKDSALESRPRRHVVLEFAEPVRGPVLLGAGRYSGFGLCLPLEAQRGEGRR